MGWNGLRVNFRNFDTVQPIAVFVRENHLLKQKIHLTLSHRKRSSVSGRSCISLKYFLKRVEKKKVWNAQKGASCASCLEVPPLRAFWVRTLVILFQIGYKDLVFCGLLWRICTIFQSFQLTPNKSLQNLTFYMTILRAFCNAA